MPNPVQIIVAMIAAVLVSAAIVFVPRLLQRLRRKEWTATVPNTGTLGIAAGFLTGVWQLSLLPAFPPSDDRSRLVFVLLPAVVLLESAVTLLQRSERIIWLMRAAAAISIAPTILHGSIYLSDAAGSNTRLWSTPELAITLAAFGASFLAIWYAMIRLICDTYAVAVGLALAFVVLCSGPTIMMSGYLSGGQLMLVLAAAVAGVSAVGWRFQKSGDVQPLFASAVGVSLVVFFGELLSAHYFAELTRPHLMTLAFAPLGIGILCIPYVRSRNFWFKLVVSIVLVCSPALIVVVLTQQRFANRSAGTEQQQMAPSYNDYLNFGK